MSNFPRNPLVEHFFRQGRPVYHQKGDIIIGMDPVPQGVYLIDTGYIKIYSITDGGEEFVHIIYGHGELFPVTWAYLNINPDLYYEALSDTLLWRVSREQFTVFAQTDVHGGYELARQVARQFQTFADRVDNLEYKKSSERIVYRLLFLASRFGVKRGRTLVVDAPFTHELIAQTINLARESVSRGLERLEHDGLIQRNGNQLVIIDTVRLSKRLSNPSNIHHWGLDL